MTTNANKPGFAQAGRFAYGFGQALFRVFAAGALLYELNALILGYYSFEWASIQLNGGDRACSALNWYANSGMLGGTTACHSLMWRFPLLRLYQEHLVPIALFYASVLAFLAGVALLWNRKAKGLLRLSRKDMETQKAHGASSPAGETETVA